jgi:hypothetical protein
VAAVSQRFEEELQRERERYHQSLHSLVQRMDSYEQREEARVEMAQQWIGQTRLLANLIQEQFEHERFSPGRLQRILANLDFAENNLAQGFLESSLSTSQRAFLDLSDLRVELEQRVLEWHAEYEKAYRALDQFVGELEVNSCVNGIGLDGEDLSQPVDVVDWSDGKYHELRQECLGRLADLARGQQEFATDELTQIYSEWLPERRASFESIIYQARMMALNSQLRMNIAEKALQALETHGFKLNESGYQNEDMHAPFLARLASSDGTRVSIQVSPSNRTAEELTNVLEVITTHPYIKTEHEARLQWEELSHTLQQFDLEVGHPSIGRVPSVTAHEDIDIQTPPGTTPGAHLIGSRGFHNV